MKLITAVACTSLLFGGAAFAAGTTGSGADTTTPETTTPSTSAAPPSGPAAQTTTATPARTAKTEHHTKAERVARMEMCTRHANDKGLTGSARDQYMHSCHLEVVPR
ncbi:MAG TPA: PsiF family protein [Steroidobacteraceae bacterium]|jgi:hypothetical protein|nr:PsiF family protein [Steroidobacteraceae bacterium]